MKAIPLWQPWASLYCSPIKRHETRAWSTDVRGWVLVHACKKFVRDVSEPLQDILDSEFGGHWGMELPTGGLIGAVNIIACKPAGDLYRDCLDGRRDWTPEDRDDFEAGDFSPGRFAIERGEWKRFRSIIPYKGEQKKFFEVPDELVREAMAA
jgi:hypothetical protein